MPGRSESARAHAGAGPAGLEPPEGAALAGAWEQRLGVEIEYPVLFTREMFSPDNLVLREALCRAGAGAQTNGARRRLAVVIDGGVAAAWPQLGAQVRAYVLAHADALELVAQPRELVGGEAAKNDPALIHDLLGWFFANKLDRHCAVLIIGGGAVLDAAGYAAAICHRGLRVVRAPTTVLGQNDAGVGVKNGVNAFGVKNALGCFAPPFAVINDHAFLRTLTRRDRLAGIAEAVKVALIRDADFFDWLEQHAAALCEGQAQAMATMIRRCAELHLAHIRDGGDPFETGSARPLDYGHWSAHKLELLSHHALRHGEAVAIGIALDSRYAQLLGRLSAAACERIEQLLAALELPRWHQALAQRDAGGRLAVLAGLEDFREHLGGQLCVTLLDDIGRSFETGEIDSVRMIAAIEHLRGYAKAS